MPKPDPCTTERRQLRPLRIIERAYWLAMLAIAIAGMIL